MSQTLRIVELHSRRLRLSPLAVRDAAAMVSVLADEQLYEYTGGTPPSLDELATRYRLLAGGPTDERERWANWIIRTQRTGAPIGFMQATITRETAQLAWLIGMSWQGQGYATEAATTVREWLEPHGPFDFLAHIHPKHEASMGVARAIGLAPSGIVDQDGEMIWASEKRGAPETLTRWAPDQGR